MSDIPSPYNFVPASQHIQFVTGPFSQDHPYRDGVCGAIEVAVTNETPLFIRGTSNVEESYQLNGVWAIPGSSLRGLIRNVVEIASFSRLGPVNDLRFGFRDLQNRPLYGQYMASIANGLPTPKVSACWLKRVAGSDLDVDITETNETQVVATLDVVDFMKVEDGLLEPLLTDRQFRLGDRNPAPARYAALGIKPGERRSVTFPAREGKVREHGAKLEGYEALGEVRRSDPAGRERITGTLVVTGQPSERRPNTIKNHGSGNPKHHDFLFYGTRRQTFPVTRRALDDFEFIHTADAEKHGQRSTPNPEWGFWRGAFDKGDPVPVFAIFRPAGQSATGREVRSFGLASMFRLAFDYTVGDACKETQPEVASTQVDFAEAVFGRVPRGKKHPAHPDDPESLKGRVSFDSLVASSVGPEQECPTVEVVFGAPKPSYYPNYVENGISSAEWGAAVPNGAPVSGAYRTLMDKTATLRGWKRYLLQDAVPRPRLPEKVQDHQKTRFRPLKSGTTFTGKIRVHNLRLHELGAILWALDFGREGDCRHGLGLAKPYGYGRVRIHVGSVDLAANDGRGGDLEAAARQAFSDHMETWAEKKRVPAGWRRSLHVENLLHLARPVPGNPSALQYPTLKPNMFTTAKRPENRWTLGPALPFDTWAAARRKEGTILPPLPGSPGAGNRTTPLAAPKAPSPAELRVPVVVPSGDSAEGCAKLVRQAALKGGQFALVRGWMKEGGPLEATRRDGARVGLGGVTERMKIKYPDIADWLAQGEPA